MIAIHLSDAEIADLCAPLSQPAAQVRYLRTLGLTVSLKPNGRPVVIRGQAEAVLAGRLVPDGVSKANTKKLSVNSTLSFRAAFHAVFGRKHGHAQTS